MRTNRMAYAQNDKLYHSQTQSNVITVRALIYTALFQGPLDSHYIAMAYLLIL